MTRRRYITRTTDTGTVTLRIHVDCDLGEAGTERVFWVPEEGGYVREIGPGRPGTLGWQVSGSLAHTGTMLTATRATLAATIRRAARTACREQERREAAW